MSHRSQTLPEEAVNTFTHGLGIVFALISMPVLLEKTRKMGEFMPVLAVLIFGFGMLAVYVSSTLYHAIQSPKLKQRLHVCDHVSIFFLIGGTYVPFIVQYADAQTATIFLSLQWFTIFVAAILKLFFIGKYESVSLFVYIFLGWSVVFLVKPFSATMPFEVFKWILIGGLSYSIGVFFYRWNKQKYAHAVWHLFVLGGTVAHYVAIWKISDYVK